MKKSRLFAIIIFILIGNLVVTPLHAQQTSSHLILRSKNYDNGQKRNEYYINEDNKQDSLQTTYYRNGQKMEEQWYDNGQAGMLTSWYENGQLKFHGIWDPYKKDSCISYYENGQLEYTGYFYHDIPVGSYTEYYENGNKRYQAYTEIIDIREYQPGHHSRVTSHKSRDTVYRDTVYYKSKGYCLNWYENGKLKNERYFSTKGLENFKKKKSYYMNGNLKSKGDMVFQKGGRIITWHENGQKSSVVTKKGYSTTRKIRTWHDNGVREYYGPRRKGKLYGKSKYWNREGVLIRQLEYKNNELIEEKKWNDDGEPI